MSEQFNDRGPFRVGEVVEGRGFIRDTHRNGRAGQIASDPFMYFHKNGCAMLCQFVCWDDGVEHSAAVDCLRRKRPPTTGEQLIRAMFDAPPVDRRQPATAWMAQYDTAQALMAMGVRVRVGEWPAEGEV
jgi:hypothetical protein